MNLKKEFHFHWREKIHLTNGVICFHPDLLKHQALIMHSMPLMANAVVAILSLKQLKNQWATKLINYHGNWTNKCIYVTLRQCVTYCGHSFVTVKILIGNTCLSMPCCIAILQDLTIHTSIIIGGGVIFSFSVCN